MISKKMQLFCVHFLRMLLFVTQKSLVKSCFLRVSVEHNMETVFCIPFAYCQDAETAYEEVREIGEHAISTADNRNVIAHTYAEARLSLAEREDEAPSPPPPPRGIFNQPPHWMW